jgi:hypothetical protein
MKTMKKVKSGWLSLNAAIQKAKKVKGPFSRQAVYKACRDRKLNHCRTGMGLRARIMVRLDDLYAFIDALEKPVQ